MPRPVPSLCPKQVSWEKFLRRGAVGASGGERSAGPDPPGGRPVSVSSQPCPPGGGLPSLGSLEVVSPRAQPWPQGPASLRAPCRSCPKAAWPAEDTHRGGLRQPGWGHRPARTSALGSPQWEAGLLPAPPALGADPGGWADPPGLGSTCSQPSGERREAQGVPVTWPAAFLTEHPGTAPRGSSPVPLAWPRLSLNQ